MLHCLAHAIDDLIKLVRVLIRNSFRLVRLGEGEGEDEGAGEGAGLGWGLG